MQEEWKHIINIDEEYEVSTLGNVRKNVSGTPIIIRPHKDRCGYLRVNILGKTHAIHRLVANAFIPNPYNYPIVHHIDENKTNNIRSNLIWCSYQQNRIFGIPSASGKNAKRKYAVLQLDMKGNLIAEWNTFTAAANSLGIKDSSIISKCARHVKHRNSAYGYKWDIRYDESNNNEILAELSPKAFSIAPEETIKALQKIINNNE